MSPEGQDRLQRLECRVDRARAGERLDRFLPEAVSRLHGVELSRRAVRRALQAGAVYVDDKRVRVASRALQTGQRVLIVLEQGAQGLREAPATPPPELVPEHVLFEDRDLIAIHKPAGLPTQATQTDALGHAEEMVRRYLAKGSKGPGHEAPYLALHQRLDRGTSGVLVMVKTKRSNVGMAAAFRNGAVDKVYKILAADDGTAGPLPDEPWTVDMALRKDGRRMVPDSLVPDSLGLDSLGKDAITELRRLEALPETVGHPPCFLLEARPKTGRKHQIRAHLAAVGLPILGDRLYAERPISQLAPRPMLHAYSLSFEHPVTSEPIRIVCPEPDDFKALCRSDAGT